MVRRLHSLTLVATLQFAQTAPAVAAAAGKTVRFSRIVEQSGRPHVHTLWLPADKDPAFKRASEAHRVLTVASDRGKTDRGVVGFEPPAANEEAQYLIFPKSLKRFDGARVVGIKFDLVEQPQLEAPAKRPARKTPGKRATKAATQTKKSESKPTPPKDRSPTVEPPAEAREESGAADVVPFTVDEAGPKPQRKPNREPRSAIVKHSTAAAETARRTDASHAALLRAVKAAMKDLQHGKSVAAYQRLEKALKA